MDTCCNVMYCVVNNVGLSVAIPDYFTEIEEVVSSHLIVEFFTHTHTHTHTLSPLISVIAILLN